ncbi:transmembrane signal receptor [Lithospermum erythrorhizon]|uniref:Receptor-like serine/threonine-protein kinase n=1 Tax=Lithospermum erythrorhizon TaxID=34254 RepID=A0AAV3QFR4_LITER
MIKFFRFNDHEFQIKVGRNFLEIGMMQNLIWFTIFLISVNLSSIMQLSHAVDSISMNQSISDGQTLVSADQSYELGFFSPGRSKNRYLGIWFKKTPDRIDWVANRDNPVKDSQGIFAVGKNGPYILNGTKNIIWAANISGVAVNPVLKLLDTGNLVLTDTTGTISDSFLWESFDYPGDTRLPGMLMGENKSGKELYLTSWRSSDDPSLGDFIYKIENIALPQLVFGTKRAKKFRSGPWNGIEFNGLPMLPNPTIPDRVVVFNGEKLMSIADPYNSSFITRLTVNQSGSIQRFVLDFKKSRWNLLYTIPTNLCDNYAQCGANGVCNANRSPMCRCLKGFRPKFQQQWDQLDWSDGCVMEHRVCQQTDGFFNVSGIKLPDLLQIEVKINMGLKECEAECLRNCSCTAYTNPYVSDGKHSCLLWYGKLIDIREFGDEKKEQNIYIRLPLDELGYSSVSSTTKKRPLKIILISVASGVLSLGLICGCLTFIKLRRQGLRRKREDMDLPLFEFHTITSATRNFSIENMIGKGGFGPVYKGILSSGQEVAVKRLSKNSGQGAQEFKNELILIAKLQHRNLVRLLGCCIQGEEMMLIYEYMKNKSLDLFIFDSHRGAVLNWPMRFNIVMDIARGLLYLHQDSRLKIIHRDLKASNILLDRNLQAKISDFGLARIFLGDETYATTKRVIGTYGYMAPEHAVDGYRRIAKSSQFSQVQLGIVVKLGFY